MYIYDKPIKLQHNEIPGKINQETGEVKLIEKRKNNIPEGTSKLEYQEFGILNLKTTKILEKHLSNLEFSVLLKMINRVEFNTNSLSPLNDDISIRQLAEVFNLSVNTVPKLFKKLFDLGVYMQLQISEDNESKQYWVLNPYIFWRGKLVKDSLFYTFKNTDISKLLQ